MVLKKKKLKTESSNRSIGGQADRLDWVERVYPNRLRACTDRLDEFFGYPIGWKPKPIGWKAR